ncbi:MAG: hypothetical protein ACXVW7_17345 [Trebonia sp.]
MTTAATISAGLVSPGTRTPAATAVKAAVNAITGSARLTTAPIEVLSGYA